MPGLSQQINTYGKDVGLRGLIMVVLSLIFCAGTKCVAPCILLI